MIKHIYKTLFITVFLYLSCNSVNSINDNNEILIQNKTLEYVSDIKLPIGFERKNTSSYGDWIRKIKLDKENIVKYYNGEIKSDQSIHVAVLDFDIGKRDLQQCADACMRIRAEYLFTQKKNNEIKFLLANGKWKSFSDYTSKKDYKSFRKYMNYIFSYANTASLKKQLKKVNNFKNIQVGDVLIQSGNPYGHAVTVMDVCEDKNGNKKFMLSQSYMPAQSIEVLINPNSKKKSPWYSVDFDGVLVTPEWTFYKKDLRRF